MSETEDNNNRMVLLEKWCSDCEYKNRTWLHDPCHQCMEDDFVENVPKYYKEEKKIESKFKGWYA